MNHKRYVLDTNILVSAALLTDSVPAQVLIRTLNTGILLASDETIAELTAVLQRPKFDAYISWEKRRGFLNCFEEAVQLIHLAEIITECRDEKDNKFLSLTVNGEADYLITGDQDLLKLHPFRNIPIIAPHTFLDLKL